MFVQHQITKHSLLERVALPSDDFELYIHEKTQQKIKIIPRQKIVKIVVKKNQRQPDHLKKLYKTLLTI